jgi:hypothetical protein
MCIIPGLRVELLDKHSDGRKAFKASVNALSGFRVMNTGEGPSHDDLTGIPEKPTLELHWNDETSARRVRGA